MRSRFDFNETFLTRLLRSPYFSKLIVSCSAIWLDECLSWWTVGSPDHWYNQVVKIHMSEEKLLFYHFTVNTVSPFCTAVAEFCSVFVMKISLSKVCKPVFTILLVYNIHLFASKHIIFKEMCKQSYLLQPMTSIFPSLIYEHKKVKYHFIFL